MKTKQARDLGKRIAALVRAGQPEVAYHLLTPVLAERTPFRLLGLIGEAIGKEPLEPVNAFLARIAADKAEGGWVVIGKALGQQFDRDLPGAFERCRGYIVAGDVWYAADILGERVPGPALVPHFRPALNLLAPWREDSNPWVRRTVGVSVHYWAKRSGGAQERAPQAQTLLAFLEPMFEEWEMSAVKGVGWGLKTVGKHYPNLLTDWLTEQIVHRQRRHRAVLLRKALTYLSDEQRARVMGETGG